MVLISVLFPLEFSSVKLFLLYICHHALLSVRFLIIFVPWEGDHCFLTFEFSEFFVYSGYQLFIFFQIFPTGCGLSIIVLPVVWRRTVAPELDEIQSSNIFFYRSGFWHYV